ncbi:amidohydrolase [Cellulomonas sp. SG140]|uniref:amidohydrolase n=1 Tax=Cellulomonas sp. SG140 TaxID=2976536 RepID=UPI0021E71642|nr:amidohydrolase [Cellulomonas sp. SG140]
MAAVDEVLVGLKDQLDGLRELYRDLHRHPELSMREHRTAELLEQRLSGLGYAVQRIGGTGVVGVLANGPGPVVLARADTDALPVREATRLDYASTETVQDESGPVPVMHACGHDMHAAALLGAAALMAGRRTAWSGTYVVLLQPGEEVGAGAQAMLDDGLTAKIPRPDVAVGQHVLPFEAGTIGTTPGPVLSAGDSVKVTVYGKGAHGSMPHNAVDPVVLAASIVLRLQTIVSRETPPGAFAVVTVGALNAGTKSNIIPDRATLLLNLRTYDAALRARVVASIERMVRAECEASGSPREPDIEYYDQFPLTSNDPGANDQVTRAFVAHFGADRVHHQEPVTASEDFSRIPDAFGIPYAYWTVGGHDAAEYRAAVAAGRVAQDIPANHSPLFAPVIDPTLATMVQTQVVAALAYLAPGS